MVKKFKRIREPEVKKALRAKFSEIKKTLDPFLNHIKFKQLKIKWWYKRDLGRHHRTNGWCNKSSLTIVIAHQYYEQYGLALTIDDIFSHEVIHLIEANHGPRFKQLSKLVNAPRHSKSITIKRN